MRRFWFIQALVTLCVVTACGHPGTSPGTSSTEASRAESRVDPAKITGVLAGPASDGGTTRGWSGSGPGGIVHAVVIGSPTAPVTFDPAVLADCGQWTVISGNTSGIVNLIEAPDIDGADTVGMSTVATTVVEGGSEITSTASTFSAYLGDYLAFVTVVTDPGSPNPPLGQEFAAELLVKTVSALRG